MVRDPQLVYAKAEEMAAKYREQMAQSALGLQEPLVEAVVEAEAAPDEGTEAEVSAAEVVETTVA
jgi:small subunit ribosomal protein S1